VFVHQLCGRRFFGLKPPRLAHGEAVSAARSVGRVLSAKGLYKTIKKGQAVFFAKGVAGKASIFTPSSHL